jgi:hypothetical protein
MWIQPKIWKKEDHFNIEDYNRIKNNFQELRALAVTLYPDFAIKEMGPDKGYQDYSFYADEINTLEDNLGRIRDSIYPYWKGETVTWYENQPFPDYRALNRIEGGCLKMYENLMGQSRGRPRCTFHLGRGRCAVCR